ncbi:putative helicase [Aurantimicrobium minutum]|uniref:DEAD/DEAH box helicase n=1 Tax=Aurantimicrobium minutum TaxID=708131 RepID=UPI00247501D9|nr:type ISP restriction/modification enzyme [Aurantimicrobium minutum]MDH6410047.1 putative helicase [Aurantimicrobium minutum]
MASSIHDILDELRSIAYDERDKGARFELLMQAYLQTEPQYASLYSDVWTWSEYPDRGTRTDTGIDLIAKDATNGELTAIQCKFYSSKASISKGDIDSFLAASSKKEFSARLIISTSDVWGKNAEEALEGQNPPVQRLRVQDLDESSIDWSKFKLSEPSNLSKKAHKTPFPHQQSAITNVLTGLEIADRGKMIMACGTGKTYTSLQIAERLTPAGGTVLFLVPSISLLSQTLKEWTIESSVPIRSFAVCSDVSVGKRTSDEDIPITDLAYPATTNTTKLVEKFKEIPSATDGITVVFSTYQSIDVVAKAQSEGVPEFDLIICDEAHRTTGVTLAGEEESAFVKVHNQSYIKGKKRLYMTATPRIYADASKSKAEEAGAVLTDMNNIEFYGEELHRLGFGEAVSIGRLTDYKVLILAVDESYISQRFQKLLADEDNSLALEDAAKIVGCWNGLSKRSLSPEDFAIDPEPMKRAVAFARNIKESKKLAEMFEHVVAAEIEAQSEGDDLLNCEVHHVDGTFNVLDRNKELDWLKQDAGEGNARILTNARCLSEGVDVPALDAVMFLNPRDSVVDVVQSVGRVMRKLEGKKYGYVILPIAVPTDVPADVALSDNKKYKVVWQVLQALRAHDERFDAMVNKIDLTKNTENKISIIGVGGKKLAEGETTNKQDFGQVTLDFPNIDEYKDAILARIVDKVGERGYWETWARDIAGIANAHITRLQSLVTDSDSALADEFARFLRGLQDNLNPFITESDAIEMLSQHLITRPVFDALFDTYSFSDLNPVSQVMQRMVDALEGEHLEGETEKLEKFYSSVRLRASGITDAGAKQHIVKELYEKFFKTAFSGTSDRLGIVYTPNEIVDFIIHSVDDVLKSEFNSGLSKKNVHVLDPFTGTGTFIVRLLQSGLIDVNDIRHKYRYELHANEIVLLAYYVAAINIEETYHSIVGEKYEPFKGIVLTDTFQMHEDDDELDGTGIFPENNERVISQKDQPITVIIGNPPYSAKQESGNDNNQNLSYPSLDSRIKNTFSAKSNAKNKVSLLDSYIRAIRWATDRIGNSGIVAFVSNGSFIDGLATDGIRRALSEECSDVFILNLRGNTRTSGEQARKEGGQTFGSGSRTTVAISILVKNPEHTGPNQIHYYEVADYMTAAEKLASLKSFKSYKSVPWNLIEPNESADWINKRSSKFADFNPLGEKSQTAANNPPLTILHSRGLETGRDAWVYRFSRKQLISSLDKTVEIYNRVKNEYSSAKQKFTVQEFLSNNPQNLDKKQISWTESLRASVRRGDQIEIDDSKIVTALYRPFTKVNVYFDRSLNHATNQLFKIFPTPESENYGFLVTGIGAAMEFSLLATSFIPDVSLFGGQTNGQFFPRYTYRENNKGFDLLAALEEQGAQTSKIDNVSDEALSEYQTKYGPEVTKDDIYFYIFGILHNPEYRHLFGIDLKKSLPRVPLVDSFSEHVAAGKELFELQANYENALKFPLDIEIKPNADFRVTKMRYGKSGKNVDKSVIIYNSQITIAGIPEDAHEYLLGSRSALDWVIERYQIKQDKESGIINDPNSWCEESNDDAYIIDLICKVVTVSVETTRIVNSLPKLDVPS